MASSEVQVWVRELAAALLVAGDKASSKGQRGVEELVLAGVGLIVSQPDPTSAPLL